eukprot:5198665-Prymnesium_polylepis.1
MKMRMNSGSFCDASKRMYSRLPCGNCFPVVGSPDPLSASMLPPFPCYDNVAHRLSLAEAGGTTLTLHTIAV